MKNEKIIIITFKRKINISSFVYNFLMLENFNGNYIKTVSNNCYAQCVNNNHLEAMNKVTMQIKKDYENVNLILNF